jgi:uncharacterized Tic20 family protein
MNVTEELQKLHELRQAGAINDNEFALAKAKLLDGASESTSSWAPSPLTGDVGPEKQDRQTRQWAFLLHLSVLAGFALPFALVVPLAIWQLKKEDLPGIDAHGKNAINWIISAAIYAVVCVLLVFVVIGIPMLIMLGILAVVFPIMAAIKANNGELWKYPLSIPFLK